MGIEMRAGKEIFVIVRENFVLEKLEEASVLMQEISEPTRITKPLNHYDKYV